ncbi:MAG: FAD-dependent oxidoreductase [Candidatus Marinimicrobia bacterium]|nr:FAD-dependent oxidoreductase [Candidatus Neomarinimicrobiota bacterium]
MKIAVVGSGVSGLVTAWLLSKHHHVSIFEKNDYVGGHVHTHTFESSIGSQNVDSGFIVFNDRTYPNFEKIINSLGVEFQDTTMGFSLKTDDDFEYSGNSVSSLFAKKRHLFSPKFYSFLLNIIKFNKSSMSIMSSLNEDVTLEEYLKSINVSQLSIDNYIIPMGASIWSTDPHKMLEMPAVFFLKFLSNHGLLNISDRPQWRVVCNGSKSYVEKLIASMKCTLHLDTPVKSISRNEDGVNLEFSDKRLDFDKVILATHSNQSLQLLNDPTDEEVNVLSNIKYQKNTATIHTDISILPKRKSAWSSWNYFKSKKQKSVLLTYNMNILQNLKSKEVFNVTINDPGIINSNKILKTINYEHPLFTVDSVSAKKKIPSMNGSNHTYYCGAYCGNGFHEDGVNSALEVCKKFNIGLDSE